MTETPIADAVITRLYRRFKEWAERGFGPEDVTWCEVKADIQEMIAEQALALRGEPTMGMWDDFCSIFPVPFDKFLDAYKFMAGNVSALRGEPVAWGLPNTSITGKKQALMMVSLEVPSDDQYGGAMWVPLVLGAAPISGERAEVECCGNPDVDEGGWRECCGKKVPRAAVSGERDE